jgi:hypothetical protein
MGIVNRCVICDTIYNEDNNTTYNPDDPLCPTCVGAIEDVAAEWLQEEETKESEDGGQDARSLPLRKE